MERIVRQGKALGLTPEQVMNVEPLASTMATLYAWAWMTREKSWLEGLASLTITEWANDDRLLQDVGGGLSSRMAKRWMDDLGFGWEQMPNFKVHSEADEEHSDMFLEDLEKFATGKKQAQVYQAAKESMDLLKIFRGGLRRRWKRLGGMLEHATKFIPANWNASERLRMKGSSRFASGSGMMLSGSKDHRNVQCATGNQSIGRYSR